MKLSLCSIELALVEILDYYYGIVHVHFNGDTSGNSKPLISN